MRLLLSTIGSRGEVEPLIGLALLLRAHGHEVRLCTPPDFQDLVDGFRIPFTPIGPKVRRPATPSAPATPTPPATPPTPEQRQQLAEATITTQFETLADAARGYDVLLAGGVLQMAARSVAEQLGIRYVYASFCAATLPSPGHAPPPWPIPGLRPAPKDADFAELWRQEADRWNGIFLAPLNRLRAKADLAEIDDVTSHMFTDNPWLAADPTLGPWSDPSTGRVLQTGAWIRQDQRPLDRALAEFLDAGEAPIYFGFGSMHVSGDLAQTAIKAARALGRRAILQRGWADLSVVDDAPDCIAIDEVNQQELFQHVAAVVHHGGAGTTTTTARAAAPQVILPQLYDQFYWSDQIERLGIGVAHPLVDPSADSLVAVLDQALAPAPVARARAVSGEIRTDGTMIAVRHLVS